MKTPTLGLDFAGPHGTVWGSVNLGLTVVSLTTAAHVFLGAPWWTGGILLGVGALGTLGRAALRTRHTPPATVAYQLACWAGSAVWAAWMLSSPAWTFRDWGMGVLYWAGATTLAGLALALGREDTGVVTLTDATLADSGTDGLTQGERDALGQRLLDAINVLGANKRPVPVEGKATPAWQSLVTFTALRGWEDNYGYTIEGSFPGGRKWGLTQLRQLCPDLAQELNLPYGCTVRAYEHTGPKAGRRDFLMDVTTRNALLEPQPFPVNEGPWTINAGLPLGRDSKGHRYEFHLRQKCLAVYGGTGSGKTSTMKATAGILALTSDCIMVGIDATGGDLVRPMLKPWEDGRATHPAFSAVAVSYPEAERLCRALIRIGHARKNGYQSVMERYNTTLLPMGALVRRSELASGAQSHFTHPDDHERMIAQIMLIGDETKEYLKSGTSQSVLRGLVGRVIDELRGGGVRCVFGPLGPTNANIDQSIQDLIDSNIAMRLGKDIDYQGALGAGAMVKAGDFPMKPDGSGKVEGVGFGVRDRGQQETQIRIWGEMKPDLVHQIAIRASEEGFLPELDYISELAANGFTPDGEPMPYTKGLFEKGDEYFWRDRWQDWTGRTTKKDDTSPQPTGSPSSTERAPGATATALMEQMNARAAEVTRAAEERCKEAEAAKADTFDRQDVAAAADRWPTTIPDDWAAGQPPPADWKARVLQAIRLAGSAGLGWDEILPVAGLHRSTVSTYLQGRVQAGELWQPAKGMYAYPPDELSWP